MKNPTPKRIRQQRLPRRKLPPRRRPKRQNLPRRLLPKRRHRQKKRAPSPLSRPRRPLRLLNQQQRARRKLRKKPPNQRLATVRAQKKRLSLLRNKMVLSQASPQSLPSRLLAHLPAQMPPVPRPVHVPGRGQVRALVEVAPAPETIRSARPREWGVAADEVGRAVQNQPEAVARVPVIIHSLPARACPGPVIAVAVRERAPVAIHAPVAAPVPTPA